MYARDVGDKTLTFVVSGLLWENSLVMTDLETESQWSHLLGEAMKGPLAGQELEILPSTMADWGTWKDRYPETTVAVLSRMGSGYRNQLHRFGSEELMDELVIGLARGETSKDWSFHRLRKHPVVNSQFDDEPVLVCFHTASGTAVIFSRLVDGRELSFELRNGQLVDRETETTWDMVTGRAQTPPLRGQQLKQLPGIVSLAGPWGTFHVFHTRAKDEEFGTPQDEVESPQQDHNADS